MIPIFTRIEWVALARSIDCALEHAALPDHVFKRNTLLSARVADSKAWPKDHFVNAAHDAAFDLSTRSAFIVGGLAELSIPSLVVVLAVNWSLG